MSFQNPTALLLLLLLIPVAWLGRPSRGYGRGREITALALRILIVVLLVLAAAGLELRRGSDALAVVFLMDASDSIPPEGQEAGRAFIESSMAEMGPEDQAAVILFGGDALIERSMSGVAELGAFTSIPDTTHSDLAEAVRLGIALFPPDAARRMVLLTDGLETTGDVLPAARLAVQAGIEFLIVPIVEDAGGQEITLTEIDIPPRLIQGEAFELAFSLHAREPETVVVRIIAGGAVVFEAAADLVPGAQTYRIPLIAGEPGFTPYSVRISTLSDHYHQNNEMAAFTEVTGPPKVLVVAPAEGDVLPFTGEPRPDEYSALLRALEAGALTVELVRPSALPFELALLGEYASVVLVDVPARDLSDRQMTALQSYVRDLGGGLVAVGGPTAYGVGGYYRTPLAETLPVDMEIKDQERRPTLTMVFIIDHSGSMMDTSGGETKLDLAKEAAIRSVELLFPGDKVGVIAFDDTATWVVPITDLSDPDPVIRAIASIGGGGGTDILAGLQAMADVLPSDDSLVKHVILLTDGGASPLGIPTLVEDLYDQYGITLTTVGVGSDAAEFLEDIAILGGGRYHFTDRPESIPNIFTEETTLATRSYIVEESFFPTLVSRSAIIGQIAEVPPLHGYVATSSKATAQTVLVSEKGDPILAVWQYGLGRAVAWTSDASARWARDWVAWDLFPTFWGQAVRATITERITSPLRVTMEGTDAGTVVTVDAVTETGSFLNGLEFAVNVVAPDGTVEAIALPQIAPGRYRSSFDAGETGVYLLRFDGALPDGENSVAALAGWVQSYSPEYGVLEPRPGFFEELAAATGGAVLTPEDFAAAFARPETLASSARPLWPELLAAALVLLPFDVAVRRLALGRQDFVRAWRRVSARFVLRPAAEAAGAGRPARMESLLRAKGRADVVREEERRSEAPQAPARPLVIRPAPEPEARPEPAAPSPAAPSPAAPAPAVPDAPGPAEEASSPQSTTAALLARKRKRDKK